MSASSRVGPPPPLAVPKGGLLRIMSDFGKALPALPSVLPRCPPPSASPSLPCSRQFISASWRVLTSAREDFELIYLYFNAEGPESQRHASEIELFAAHIAGEFAFHVRTYQQVFARVRALARPEDAAVMPGEPSQLNRANSQVVEISPKFTCASSAGLRPQSAWRWGQVNKDKHDSFEEDSDSRSHRQHHLSEVSP
jgi:hypothetical protein